MKKSIWFTCEILVCIGVTAGGYFWATAMISSLYNFRSPLHADPPTPGVTLTQGLTRKVVLVLIDALRVDTSEKPQVMPFLNELRARSAWATIHSRVPSYSDPGYSVILTGAWPDISDGPAMNLEYADTPTWTQDNLFSAVHRAKLGTAVSGYYWFQKLIPQAAVDASFYTPGEDNAADLDVVQAALPMLEKPYQFVLIHIDQVDYAGHYQGGPRDPRWDQAATRSDNLLREIAAKMDFKLDTLIVLSDHGQIDRGGHGGQDPVTLIEPFVMLGPTIKPGQYKDIYQVDIAPTVAVLLGANIPADNQGHVLTAMLNLPSAELPVIQAALQVQQSQLFAAYTTAIGSTATVAAGSDPVAVTQAAMDQARASRQARERLPRILLASMVALIPEAVLILRRSRTVPWILGGALLYLLLFNLRYALLAGRTYSLSSVASQNDIILFTAITAALALLITWLVSMLVLKAFRAGPMAGAKACLSLTLMTLYLLSLPVLLHFALNGAVITWTIPDFLTMFLGFLSVLQGLIVAVVGLLLTGLTALIAALLLRSKRSAPTS